MDVQSKPMDYEVEDYDYIIDMYDCGDNNCIAVANHPEYFVATSDGDVFEMETYYQARIYAGLRAIFGEIDLWVDDAVVPEEVALAGKPAITTYLLASNRAYYESSSGFWVGKEKLADRLGVSPDTVQKYVRKMAKKAKEKRIGGQWDSVVWR